ncbi:ATPase PAAT isoform X1 [Scophthalmus maximus]|uniref:Si:rp71-19m20.1 n=2 Tax=Scophthalmus maximus TaxID=52904 RepID=A0A8D3ALB6_SCOMX|nr:ATPase PAAT isoform X1 [Scophthalmus maximus]
MHEQKSQSKVHSPCGLISSSSSIMVDIAVKSGAAWVCQAQGRQLADVLLPVHIADKEEELSQSQGDKTNRCSPVLLEQTEDGSPCVLTIHCSPGSPAAIGRLLVVSEARTMELYDQTGEYCGTVRGERDHGVQQDSEDRGPFYRKQLILELPSAACEVKLLSLAGRSSLLVCRIVVGLQPPLQQQPGPVRGPGIDMEQVQCLVEEMGTSLSPGAQNLMEMVHYQQKNQTGSLGGFLPLLMGSGAFSILARGANASPGAVSSQTQSAESTPPASVISAADEAPLTENRATSASSPDSLLSGVNTNNAGQVSHAHLAQMMSHFLKGQHGQALTSGPELLPMLQSVCGQVTQLRLDDAAVVEREKKLSNGSWELDSAMERRLEEMEKRLKEHVDRRLDALEQKLEQALLSALHQGETSGSAGGVRGAEGPRAPCSHALTSDDLT